METIKEEKKAEWKLKHCWWNINSRCNNPKNKDYKYY